MPLALIVLDTISVLLGYYNRQTYLIRKMKAWTQKGVVIHDAVNAAQRGWSSSDKSKKVSKSVVTSKKPRMTLKKTNLQSANILRVLVSATFWKKKFTSL